MDKRTLALLKVHGTAVFFGASGIFGLLIQSSAETIVLGRVMIAFAMISLYFLWKKQPLVKLNGKQILQQAISGGLLATHWVTFFTAVKVGGVAVATLGFASFPAFVALFESLFFHEKLRFREIVLLIAITIGLILVTPEFTFGNEATQGLLWGILSALVYGILAVSSSRKPKYDEQNFRCTSELVAIYLCNHTIITVFCCGATYCFRSRLVLDFLCWFSLHNIGLYFIYLKPRYN